MYEMRLGWLASGAISHMYCVVSQYIDNNAADIKLFDTFGHQA